VFFNPSLRTLASFQAGMSKLGGTSFVITPGQGTWQLETRLGTVMNGAAAEHVREGIPVLASYCDALGIRAFADGKSLQHDLNETAFNAMADVVTKPLINLESAVNHPCQALADWKTMDDLGVARNGKFVLSWVYHPRGLPLAVPAAALHMAAQRGMEVVVARPEGYALPPEIMNKARKAAELSGGSVRETSDRREALEGAQVLYAKEWGSTQYYGDPEGDGRLRANLKDWCVKNEWFANAASDCRLMHCLPVRRNTAVADEVLDGPRSVVQREAYNRLVVQMAVLYKLLKGS
jgi:N-acetylornithine carbamoyltransferase